MKPRRNRKPVTFEGHTFASRDEFYAAFPAYARALHHIEAGADTIIKVERVIATANARARKVNRDSIKTNRLKRPSVAGRTPL